MEVDSECGAAMTMRLCTSSTWTTNKENSWSSHAQDCSLSCMHLLDRYQTSAWCPVLYAMHITAVQPYLFAQMFLAVAGLKYHTPEPMRSVAAACPFISTTYRMQAPHSCSMCRLVTMDTPLRSPCLRCCWCMTNHTCPSASSTESC